MRLLSRLFIFVLVWLLPVTSYAQFVSIDQAKQTASLSEQGDLEDVLNQITDKGSTARRQVQSILAEAATQKLGNSAASRRIETLIGKLKSDLNGVINVYAKKNPPGNNLRAAFNLAQDTLNGIRRQAGEVLDQIGFDKAASPNKLSGKYLEYQEKIKELADKGLVLADDRLADRGTKTSVKKALEQIIQDTQQKIDIATTAFLTSNGDVLPSAIERIKKGVLDELSQAMAQRFKTADARGSDKALDLSEEDLREVEAAKKEMTDIVDRAINTVQGLMEQAAGSQLPTSSQIPGVNPLLEAKYRVQKQARTIQETANGRIKKISDRFASRTDVSALAKEVLAKEVEREKNRLNDTIKEFDDYFLAGDPSRKKYNAAKNDAQDKAAGCTSFLCDIGRVASGVGSGLLKSATGIDIGPRTFTTIMGIKDPQGYVPSRFTGGNYGGTYNGNSYGASGYGANPYNPNCVGKAPALEKHLTFVEKAQAQSKSDPGTGEGRSSSSGGFLSNVNWTDVFRQAAPWINQTAYQANLRQGQGYFGNCFGYASAAGGLPGYGSTYNAPFGAFPVGQYLGYSSNNLQLNLGSNYVPQLIAGFGLMAQINPADSATYRQVVSVLSTGQLDPARLAQVAALLNKTDFYKVPGSYYGSSPVTSLFYNMCSQVYTGNQALVELCKNLLKPITTPGINPFPNSQSPDTKTTAQTTAATQVRGYTTILNYLNTSTDRQYKCSTNKIREVEGYNTSIETIRQQFSSNVINDLTGWGQVGALLSGFDRELSQYRAYCGSGNFPLPSNSLEETINSLSQNLNDVRVWNTAQQCAQRPVALAMQTNDLPRYKAVLDRSTNDPRYGSATNFYGALETQLSTFLANCRSSIQAPTTQAAPSTTTPTLTQAGNFTTGAYLIAQRPNQYVYSLRLKDTDIYISDGSGASLRTQTLNATRFIPLAYGSYKLDHRLTTTDSAQPVLFTLNTTQPVVCIVIPSTKAIPCPNGPEGLTNK